MEALSFPGKPELYLLHSSWRLPGCHSSAFGCVLTEPLTCCCLIRLCDLLPPRKSKLLTGPSPRPASTNEPLNALGDIDPSLGAPPPSLLCSFKALKSYVYMG